MELSGEGVLQYIAGTLVTLAAYGALAPLALGLLKDVRIITYESTAILCLFGALLYIVHENPDKAYDMPTVFLVMFACLCIMLASAQYLRHTFHLWRPRGL